MRHPQKNFFRLPGRDLAEIVSGVGPDWERLRGARIFLTGGTGFFGKWILGALAFADAELDLKVHLTVLSRSPRTFLEKYPEASRWNWLEGDVATFSSGEGDAPFDFILHAATDTLGVATPADEERRARAIMDGTRRMAELAQRSRARRLHISSGAVYGSAAAKPAGACEDDFEAALPLTPYARAKREAELLCANAGLDFVTARAFAFLGPHLPLDAHYAAGNFLRDAARGGPIIVRGDGTALRSYLYPTDLVVWLLRILLRGQRGHAYNVGSNEVVSTGALAGRIADAASPRPQVVFKSTQQTPAPPNIYLCDPRRTQDEMGLRVSVPLDEAIQRSLVWLSTR